MSITENTFIDKIEITAPHQDLQVREANVVLRDGVEIARSYHRWLLSPGTDVSEMPANVQAIAAAVWTPEVIAAYQAAQAEAQSNVKPSTPTE